MNRCRVAGVLCTLLCLLAGPVRWNGGVVDIHPRLSRMIEEMAGGVDVEAAFEREFGRSATVLLEDFQQFLNETQDDPYERLRGMMWDRGL